MTIDITRLYDRNGACKLCRYPAPTTGVRKHDDGCPGLVFVGDTPVVYVASWLNAEDEWMRTTSVTKEGLVKALEEADMQSGPRSGLMVASVRRELEWGEDVWGLDDHLNDALIAGREARRKAAADAASAKRVAETKARITAALVTLRSTKALYTDLGLLRQVESIYAAEGGRFRGPEDFGSLFLAAVTEGFPEWTQYVPGAVK